MLRPLGDGPGLFTLHTRLPGFQRPIGRAMPASLLARGPGRRSSVSPYNALVLSRLRWISGWVGGPGC